VHPIHGPAGPTPQLRYGGEVKEETFGAINPSTAVLTTSRRSRVFLRSQPGIGS